MTRRTKARALMICATLALYMGAAVSAGLAGDERDDDHDDARDAFDSGQAMALEDVLTLVRPQIDGELIEIEFEIEDGIAVYEFTYIDGEGRVREIYVDARDGRLLEDEPD